MKLVKLKNREKKIDKKIREEVLAIEKINELRKNQNFKSKAIV